MSKIFINCMECGKRVATDERHDYSDCMNELKARVAALEVELKIAHRVIENVAISEDDPQVKATLLRIVADGRKVLEGGGK